MNIVKTKYLINIISEFESWYISDQHSKNIDYYKNQITKNYIAELSDDSFLDLFYDFYKEGGKIQSGGDRNKNEFLSSIINNLSEFRQIILEPFDEKFNAFDWLDKIIKYKKVDNKFIGFGFGISTIYLNRVNKNLYPVLNDKTIKALQKMGHSISSSKNVSNYKLVGKYQNNLIKHFPQLEDFYKTDALNHFLVEIYQGPTVLCEFDQIKQIEDDIEQTEIESLIKEITNSENSLIQQIINCENVKEEFIIVSGKRIKRNNYLMVLIKKYRGYSCQFCKTKILKRNGEFYIEACHIRPKSNGGKDKMENILVLCPNCHKKFDFGLREEEIFSDDGYYKLLLNKEGYTVKLRESTVSNMA